MIVGSITHDRGSVSIDGADITDFAVHQRARKGIGYLPQEASVFRKLSVRDNLLAILELRSDLQPAERAEQAEQLMADFRINHIQNNLGLSLSGGERRRVETTGTGDTTQFYPARRALRRCRPDIRQRHQGHCASSDRSRHRRFDY